MEAGAGAVVGGSRPLSQPGYVGYAAGTADAASGSRVGGRGSGRGDDAARPTRRSPGPARAAAAGSRCGRRSPAVSAWVGRLVGCDARLPTRDMRSRA